MLWVYYTSSLKLLIPECCSEASFLYNHSSHLLQSRNNVKIFHTLTLDIQEYLGLLIDDQSLRQMMASPVLSPLTPACFSLWLVMTLSSVLQEGDQCTMVWPQSGGSFLLIIDFCDKFCFVIVLIFKCKNIFFMSIRSHYFEFSFFSFLFASFHFFFFWDVIFFSRIPWIDFFLSCLRLHNCTTTHNIQ